MENIQTSISEPISARTLTPSHFDHLLSQGFTTEHVETFSNEGIIESVGCAAITEGMKDALAFTHLGGIPTGALSGLSHASKALPRNCGYTIIADYDAWVNFGVFQALIKGGVHCGGKVAIVPAIENEPKAGGVEYFKAGHTAGDYQQFLDDALSPIALYEQWLTTLPTISSPSMAGTQAVNAGKLLGEIYGYAESGTVGEIKLLLKSDRFTEWDLRLADVLRDSANTQSALKQKNAGEGEIDNKNVVQIALDLIKDRAKLFHSPSPDGTEYASIPASYGGCDDHSPHS